MIYYKTPGQFLSNTSPIWGTDFAGTDTKALFESNLTKMPAGWHYRTVPVSYIVNAQGYRAPEFNTIDWNSSIVVFGCSQTFGIGLAQHETLSARLQQLTGIPVVNMGMGGSSMFHAFYNQVCLKEIGARPLAMVNVWTSHYRLAEWKSDKAHGIGPWSIDQQGELFSCWNFTADNPMGYANMIYRAAKIMHSDRPQYHMTFFKHVAEAIGVDSHPTLDNARDLIHVGPQTVLRAAQQIVKNLDL
jgi:hypothetical protein